ncbi:inositol monophosphatase family protein [Pseudoroseomonas globiformis]|uniref:Inositol monophosphatase family protein n=1 Tax=Teichococcus globiformis TaxID=2307229 RepID=A0ABV7FWT1_9PROT
MTQPFTDQHMAVVARILRDAAMAEIRPRFRRLRADAVRFKSSPTDLVTDADEAAERRITAELRRFFPGCVVVGEESCAADPALLQSWSKSDLVFFVDPVDGTANFAAGVPLFGSMAAAVQGGEVIAAWIYDPMGDDTAMAIRGKGAWIETPCGQRSDLQVASPAPVSEMLASISWTYMAEPIRSRVAHRMTRFRGGMQFRCAAHEYRLVAGGGSHILVYHRLMPWDHLPGWLLHREAGGYSARFDGSEYRPEHVSGGLIVAPDRSSWDAVRTALLD